MLDELRESTHLLDDLNVADTTNDTNITDEIRSRQRDYTSEPNWKIINVHDYANKFDDSEINDTEVDDIFEDEIPQSLADGIRQRNSNNSSSNKKRKRNSNDDETCIYCMNIVNNVVISVPDIICTCSVICSDSLVRGRLI